MCCVDTRSLLKYTDSSMTEFLAKSYEMLIITEHRTDRKQ